MSIKSTQIALVIEEKLGPFVLRDVPIYTPGQGEVLIKLHASALNPADWMIQKSGLMITKYPAILGLDLAGEIVAVGEGVQSLQRGDRVLTISRFIENQFMGLQQYSLANEVTTAKIPDNISYDQAATLPVCFSTAVTGFFADFHMALHFPFLPLKRRESIQGNPLLSLLDLLQWGSLLLAIQLAKLLGFLPIIATASLRNTDYLKSIGTTNVLDRNLESADFDKVVHEITGGRPVEYTFTALSIPQTETLALAILPKDGMLISSSPNVSDILKKADFKIATALATPTVPWNKELFKTIFSEKLTSWLEKGDIKPNRVEVVKSGLAGVVKGLKKLEDNAVSGFKIVVRPLDTPPL
ncbi:chaperonin 10-like protein [Crepidotus variabilis]|uniref:Chaperonin 10-like protein n=1 Tax=Crepidotus variabilis TaxID=179855 RepID=A0A9P6JQ70_9AGAR|nr:chaperonin 10-like protein [Crepidotus variabilis]